MISRLRQKLRRKYRRFVALRSTNRVCHGLLKSIDGDDHIIDMNDCYSDGRPKLEYDLSDRVVREYANRVIDRCFEIVEDIYPVSDDTIAAVYGALTNDGRLVEIGVRKNGEPIKIRNHRKIHDLAEQNGWCYGGGGVFISLNTQTGAVESVTGADEMPEEDYIGEYLLWMDELGPFTLDLVDQIMFVIHTNCDASIVQKSDMYSAVIRHFNFFPKRYP